MMINWMVHSLKKWFIIKAVQNYQDRFRGLTFNGSSGSSFGINIVQYPFTMYSKKVYQIAHHQLCKYCNVQEAQLTLTIPSIHICAIFGAVQKQTLCKFCARGNATQDLNCCSAPSPALVQIFSNSVQVLCRSCFFSARDLSSQIADLFLLVVHHPL